MGTRHVLVAMVAGLLLGCSAGGKSVFEGGGSGGGGNGSGGGGNGSGGGTGTPTTNVGGFTGGGGQGGGGPPPPAEVYGHGPDVLYKLDPVTKLVVEVGGFQGCSSVIDLAIDKDNLLMATTFDGLYRIDKLTAKCTLVASGSYPNSLSFVPEGVLDAASEVLVGYLGSSYVRIDTVTGAVSTVGSLGQGYASSGDIVSVKDGGTFLTVNGNECGDCLVEVNPKTGAMTKMWGPVGYASVFGLAYWGGSAYGFSNGGQLFEIHFGTDDVTTTPIAIPSAPANLKFWGAGSSTHAPIAPPD